MLLPDHVHHESTDVVGGEAVNVENALEVVEAGGGLRRRGAEADQVPVGIVGDLACHEELLAHHVGVAVARGRGESSRRLVAGPPVPAVI